MSRNDDTAERWVDRALAVMARGGGRELVKLLDAAMVCAADDRTRLDQDLGDFIDVIDAHLGREPIYGSDAPSLSRVVRVRNESS